MDFGQGKIVPVNLEHEMKNSYIDYAMSVIVARALPDVRDGLKPVHRRILYAMQEAGMGSNKPYKKSARIVGEVLGKYHPHGDSSVYDAIVRMAQDFSMRYMLADGHGNFGSVDGDPAAAMRYTEVRMSKIAELMLQDIDKETVDFAPNYDESLKEPTVLPAKFPQLLVNGTSGIAVGMATNIPPHNMCEVIDGTLMLIDHPEATIDDLMKVIKGPDFPTAGLVLGQDGIRQAYTTGRGVIKMRANARIETLSNGKPRIIVTELPYQVNKARLVEKIAQLVRDKQIEGITALNDESDRGGMRIVIDLRRDANANVILNQLYKHTQLQDSFGVIMLALVDGKPKILNLKEVLHYYIAHQEDVITRRTRYDLKKAEARAHILEGLTIALDHLDAVITTIRESRTADIARAALIAGFKLSEKQAQAILDLRLQRLTGLEREKIEEEYQEVLKAIENYKAILADESRILGIIKDELKAVKAKFGDARRTRLTIDTSEIDVEDLIAEEDVVITLTHNNYIKRMALDTYRRQNRGGKGVKGMPTKEKDFVENLLITTTHHTILFFTNRGRVHRKKGYLIPEAGRTARGTNIVNILPLEPDERVTAMLLTRDFPDNEYLAMVTRNGTVKRLQLSAVYTARKAGIRVLSLDEGDELIGVMRTSGSDNLLIATRNGMAICFAETDVRPMGRDAAGVRGIRLGADDCVIGAAVAEPGKTLLTVTENGYGKRTPVESYLRGDEVQGRGGKGMRNYRLTDKTGPVAGAVVVSDTDDIMLIESGGVILRTPAGSINLYGRDTQGVILMRVEAGSRLIAVQRVEGDLEEE